MNYLDIKLEGIDENGEKQEFALSDFKGKNVVLYFYPKDETPVCTKEAKNFNEHLGKMAEDTIVIGVSADNLESHLSFKDKLGLKFKLLTDKNHGLKQAIHEFIKKHLKHEHEMQDRITILLNKDGEIIKTWAVTDVDKHVQEIIEYLNTLN